MRNAMAVLITFTVAAVVVGSLFMWLLDRESFPNYGTAIWFVLQTVTTVGYGDVTPTSPEGRVVAGVVMVVAIAFLAIITAMITSTFIDALQRQRQADDTDALAHRDERVDARFDEILERLGAIEAALKIARDGAPASRSSTSTPADPPVPSDPPLPPDATRTATGD